MLSPHSSTGSHPASLDGAGQGQVPTTSIPHSSRSTSHQTKLLANGATEPDNNDDGAPPSVVTAAGVACTDEDRACPTNLEATNLESTTPSIARSRRFKRLTPYVSHYLFAALIVTFHVVAIAGAIAIPFTLLMYTIAKAIGMEASPNFQITLIVFAGLAGSLLILQRGHAMRTLGIRRMDLRPRLWKRRLRMPSIAHQLKLLYVAMGVCVALPVIALASHAYLAFGSNDSTAVKNSLPFLFGWLAFMLGGVTILTSAVSCLRDFRSRAFRNSLRFHHRGVALRSFIAEFDSPLRSIYESCSLSRRISLAHRTVFITCIASFSLAGCLAAYIQSDAYLGEMLAAISVLGILIVWPTKRRLVKWSAELLDPFCKPSDEEYEIYS